MDQACCPSAAANFKQLGHAPSGDALAGEGSPGGPGLGKLVQPVASRASGHGFSSAPSSAWKSGPSRWEDRGPSIDGSAVKRDCLGPAQHPRFQKPLWPLRQPAGRFPNPHPRRQLGPLAIPRGERERREDRRGGAGAPGTHRPHQRSL